MTDTNTTDEQTETTFGIDATEIEAAYNKAIEESDRVYNTVYEAAHSKLRTARDAVNELLNPAGHTAAADHINGLLRSLSAEHTNKQANAAVEARGRLIEAADKQREEALAEDPFTKRAATVVKRQYGDEYARVLLTNAPFTFASLRQLAVNQSWCTDYERAMKEFVRAGALPDETRVVTRDVHWRYVPSEKGPKEGETWVAHMTLPSYVRDIDRYGDPYPHDELSSYAVSVIEYEKTADAPKTDAS